MQVRLIVNTFIGVSIKLDLAEKAKAIGFIINYSA